MNDSGVPSKLADYTRNPSYERRLVVFYDVLGWRSEIEGAGQDPERIGKLRRLILMHSRVLRMPINVPVNVSTFSDNIVISTPVTEHVTPFLRSIAVMQLLTVSARFLLRGGITVGDIYHDDEAVFGPALNRAYELESKVAVYPRILVDEPVLSLGNIDGFGAFEGGLHFLDPFTPAFVKFWLDRSSDRSLMGDSFAEAGVSAAGNVPSVPGDIGLQVILEYLKKRIRAPIGEKDYVKVAWLFDRIASRLGRPRSNSYPRESAPDDA